MRLARNILENIAGLEIYPIIGILVFLAFFIGVVIWVVRLKSNKAEEYSKMPLTNEDKTSYTTNDELDTSKPQKD